MAPRSSNLVTWAWAKEPNPNILQLLKSYLLVVLYGHEAVSARDLGQLHPDVAGLVSPEEGLLAVDGKDAAVSAGALDHDDRTVKHASRRFGAVRDILEFLH